MIKVTTTPHATHFFCCTILTDSETIEYNIQAPENFIANPATCQSCHQGKISNHCNLLEALLPIFVYFSGLTSSEKVNMQYVDSSCTISFTGTAQRACFLHLIYAMCYSKCTFFSKFKSFLKYYNANFTHETLMHFILTSALIKKHLDVDGIYLHTDIFQETKRLTNDIKKRLYFILENCKQFQNKDAAINALSMIFSLNYLTSDYLKEFYQSLVSKINDIPLFENNLLV